MTFTTLPSEKLTLPRLLAETAKDKAVFLTVGAHVRYVVLPADDGDQEVCALQNNAQFMAYLQACIERAKTGKRFTLAQIKDKYGLGKKPQSVSNASRGGTRRATRNTA